MLTRCRNIGCNEERDGACAGIPCSAGGGPVSCDACQYEGCDEQSINDGSDWRWVYHCNLAGCRRIERDAAEPFPAWCPLHSEAKQEGE